jgi:hypothetical protein
VIKMPSADECGSIKAAKEHLQNITGHGDLTPAEEAVKYAFLYMHSTYPRLDLASKVLREAVMGIVPAPPVNWKDAPPDAILDVTDACGRPATRDTSPAFWNGNVRMPPPTPEQLADKHEALAKLEEFVKNTPAPGQNSCLDAIDYLRKMP